VARPIAISFLRAVPRDDLRSPPGDGAADASSDASSKHADAMSVGSPQRLIASALRTSSETLPDRGGGAGVQRRSSGRSSLQ
jgi:hypothetical protein